MSFSEGDEVIAIIDCGRWYRKGNVGIIIDLATRSGSTCRVKFENNSKVVLVSEFNMVLYNNNDYEMSIPEFKIL